MKGGRKIIYIDIYDHEIKESIPSCSTMDISKMNSWNSMDGYLSIRNHIISSCKNKAIKNIVFMTGVVSVIELNKLVRSIISSEKMNISEYIIITNIQNMIDFDYSPNEYVIDIKD